MEVPQTQVSGRGCEAQVLSDIESKQQKAAELAAKKKAKQKDKKPKKEAFQLDSESAQHVLKGSIAMRKYCTDVKDGLVEAAEAMEEMCPPGSTPKVLGPER